MSSILLSIKVLNEKAKEHLPRYMSEGASGMDLVACLDESVTLQPGERKLIPTGIAIALPVGYEAQVRPRSGLAIKHGISLVNAPGTIDSDYRGEIGLIMINLGQESLEIMHGMRLAQMVISSYTKADIEIVDTLDETVRGSGGFGHTGTHHESISQ